jgi:hypothetical protein
MVLLSSPSGDAVRRPTEHAKGQTQDPVKEGGMR